MMSDEEVRCIAQALVLNALYMPHKVRPVEDIDEAYERFEKWAHGLDDRPDGWDGWQAGRKDLAQQVYDLLQRSHGKLPGGAHFIDGTRLGEITALLREHGAWAQQQ